MKSLNCSWLTLASENPKYMDEEKWQFCCRLLLSCHYTLIRNFKRKSRSNSIQRPFTVNYTRPFLIHFAEQLLSDSDGVKSQYCSPMQLQLSQSHHMDTSCKSKWDLIHYETRTPKFRLHYGWIYMLSPSFPRETSWKLRLDDKIQCIFSPRAPQQVRCHCLPLIGSCALFSELPGSSLLCNGERRFKI